MCSEAWIGCESASDIGTTAASSGNSPRACASSPTAARCTAKSPGGRNSRRMSGAVSPPGVGVARSGAVLLEAVQHLPEPTALRAVRVGTRGIVELDPLQERVEVDLLLRNHAERLDAGDESGLAALVRPEPGELLDVPAGDVHEDRLGRVVEVQAGRYVVRLDLAGRAVQRLAPEGPAVATRDRFGIAGHDLVHRMPRRVLVGEDPMLDAAAPTERLRALDAREPIGGDAFVDRDPDELDVPPPPEEVREQGGGPARILAPATADGDPLAPLQIDLRVQLALRTSLDELDEVAATEMFAAVPNPLDRRGIASVALHGPTQGRAA